MARALGSVGVEEWLPFFRPHLTVPSTLVTSLVIDPSILKRDYSSKPQRRPRLYLHTSTSPFPHPVIQLSTSHWANSSIDIRLSTIYLIFPPHSHPLFIYHHHPPLPFHSSIPSLSFLEFHTPIFCDLIKQDTYTQRHLFLFQPRPLFVYESKARSCLWRGLSLKVPFFRVSS